MKNKSKEIKKIHISGKKIIIILSLITLLLIIILLIQTNSIKNPINFFNKNIEKREVLDKCSVISGKLIHTIKNEEACQNICVAECESMKGTLKNSEFYEENNNCNKCNCYCKI